MRVSDALDRAKSYSKTYVTRRDIDYGGVYHITYTSPGKTEDYFIFVVHPNLDGKIHCLDLAKIEKSVFDDFLDEVKVDDKGELLEKKQLKEGIVKDNIKIGSKFYESFIKPNNRLMKNYPYKTLDYNKVKNIRYIPYDTD